MEANVDGAADLLREATQILVFTGAGLSTESGIPDFRGPNGVWTKVDPAEFTFDRYLSNSETRRRSWQMRQGSDILDAAPNRAHEAIVELWDHGRLVGCVTQNIDGLHQSAGLPAEAVVELHGNAHRSNCLSCDSSWPTNEMMARVASGDADPHCECGGIIKVAVISFGEAMPVSEMDRAYEMAERCDAVISAGSTLSVYPAAYIPLEAKRRGIPYVIVNLGPTDQDLEADVRVEGSVGDVLPELVAALSE